MDNTTLNTTDSDQGGWHRRFKGKVELLRHVDDHIEVVAQLYSLPRPPASDLVAAKERVAQFDVANEADRAALGKSYVANEQVLFLGTVDPVYRLLLRVIATRPAPDAAIASVIVEARSARLPHLYERDHLAIGLSAANQQFATSVPTTFGRAFSDVPIAALGSLRVELRVKI